jgi:hypothetical protein
MYKHRKHSANTKSLDHFFIISVFFAEIVGRFFFRNHFFLNKKKVV